MSKIILSFVFALLLNTVTFCQFFSYKDLKNVSLNGVDAITENNQVIGYYYYYFKDKASYKENVYELSILDANLNQTHTVELIKSKYTNLLEGSFNGTNFCFSFVDIRNKTLQYEILDKAGKSVASYTSPEMSEREIYVYEWNIKSAEDFLEGSLVGVENTGFVRYGNIRSKEAGLKGCIQLIDHAGKLVWTAQTNNVEKKHQEVIEAFYTDKNTVVSLVTTNVSVMDPENRYSLLFNNVSDGKEMFRYETDHTKGHLVPMGAQYDASTKEFTVYGEYYGKKGSKLKPDYNNRLGVFITNLDLTGKVIEEHFIDWVGDIGKVLPLSAKGKTDGNFSVFIHDLIKTADNKFFIIGEQFKESVALGNDANYGVPLKLQNLIMIELNSSFVPVTATIVEKDHSTVNVPYYGGANAIASTNELGRLAKKYNRFEYSFTSRSNDAKTFNCTYLNYDHVKNDKDRFIVGNIGYDKDGKLQSDNIPITSKATAFAILPAKQGYVFIFEYFKFKKEATVRLEKLDF